MMSGVYVIVEILNVIGHRHGQFYYGGPLTTVEKFGLHSFPYRFASIALSK